MAELNQFAPVTTTKRIIGETPSFSEGVAAQLGSSYGQVFEQINRDFSYRTRAVDGYNPLDREAIAGYEQYAYSLMDARSPEETAAIKAQIDLGIERRQTLGQMSFWKNLGVGLFDPVNLVAVPLSGGSSFVGSVSRAALGTAAVEVGVELGMRQMDPTATAEEGAMNVAMAGIFGGGFGALGGVARISRARAFERTQEQIAGIYEAFSRTEELKSLSPDEIRAALPREDRLFGRTEEAELRAEIDRLSAQRVEGLSQESLDAIDQQIKPYRDEIGLRSLEDAGVNLADPYKILPNWFTNSPLFKAVSTPMKRALEDNIPSSVKETFVKAYGDAGLTLNLNSIGLPTPQSAYQRIAVDQARWVQVNDELMQLWSADTGATPKTVLDVNAVDLSRRVTRSGQTFAEWSSELNRKRISGETRLTENEIKGIEAINRYFEEAETRLTREGLLSNDEGLKVRLARTEEELRLLEADINKYRQDAAKSFGAERYSDRQLRERMIELYEANNVDGRLVAARIRKLDSDKFFVSSVLEADGTGFAPREKEPFFPRFFDQDKIRRDRSRFEKVIYDWYSKNPYIFEFNFKEGKWVRKDLATHPKLIQERVTQTVDRILGEANPADLDKVSFGGGRGKHFMSRELDIPNSLVADFIVTNPVAAMKTYAMRVEPRYQFARQFGGELDKVTFGLERDMLRAGNTIDEINRTMRDFKDLHSQVFGTSLRNPNAWNQKIARVMREAAAMNYLGSAGLAAVADFGRVVMESEMESVVKAMFATMDKNAVALTAKETRLAGGALDMLLGSAHMRLMEDFGNNIAGTIWDKARNSFYTLNGLTPVTTIAKNFAGMIQAHQIIDDAVKIANGTASEKTIQHFSRYGLSLDDAKRIARAPWQTDKSGLHLANTEAWADNFFIPEVEGKRVNVIEYDDAAGSRVGKDTPNGYAAAFYDPKTNTIRFDREFIEGEMYRNKAWTKPRREGVKALPENAFPTPQSWSNFVMLHEIMHTRFSADDLGFDKSTAEGLAAYENRINEMAMDEHKTQTTIQNDLIEKFRVALNSNIMNSVLHASPADKPIITRGVVYIPTRIAERFGLKEDPQYRGYARIENGLLGLPFQFYNYALAAVNKTTASLAGNQVKNRMIGVASMLGLAYMITGIRTPNYVWQDMSFQDKFARSFDMSGIAALYSDLMYTSIHTSLALGGPNITAGLISPKFPQKPSVVDAITGVAGAGPSWTADTAQGIIQFATGEYGEGAKNVMRNMPFARMWFWKDEVNQLTRAWAG